MPIQTDLSGSPYYDDYDSEKNYYKILFRPGVAVQARELNQLQTILQDQIERFGDNIFKQGTIISGCEFSYHPNVPYVKIKDLEADGTRVEVANYKGAYVRNTSGVIGRITDVSAGFESRDDKNTLFVNYLTSGNTLNTFAFSADDVLTVYNPSYPINEINIIDGSVGFSNTDTVVITPAISIQNSTGGTTFANTISVGDIITNTLVANAQIVEVDTTSNTDVVILRLKPLATNLANTSANSQWWTFTANDSVTINTGSTGKVVEVIGANAEATIVTTGAGTVSSITMDSVGSGYYINPTVYIFSSTATSAQITNLNLTAQAFIGRCVVTGAPTTPVGMGYGVTVNEGVIYQKGYFVSVDPQFLIVNSYSNQPNNVVVGFRTEESIIDSNIDQSLLDNSLGTPNSIAPGANRLKLTGTIVTLEKEDAESDNEFLSIIEFSNGRPYIQRKQTQYNIINNELARRTFEESGNYIIDPFLVTSRSETTFAAEANTFSLVVDPGIAYINGKRIETLANYVTSVDKGTDVNTDDVTISLNYGNYVRINQVGGLFKFNTGDQVKLYSDAKQHITLTPTAVPSAPSTLIGVARIRSIAHEEGIPGTRTAVYRLYLFDIQMSAGKNFTQVRSVFYDGTNKAVGDIVTSIDPSTSATICQLYDSKLNSLVQYAGASAIKTVTSGLYTYRTVDETLTANAAGYVVFNTGANEIFPYVGTISTSQEREFVVVPLANGQAAANLAGGISVYSVNTSMIGTSTSFLTQLNAGDWVRVANASVNTVVQVQSIANNTFATLTANASANVAVSANGVQYFPQYIPISFEPTTRSITVSANQTQVTANLGVTLAADVGVSVAYNVRTTPTPVAKTVVRDRYVRIKTSNNVANTVGPWALGVADAFRLKSVYVADGGSNTLSINAASATSINSAGDFIIYSGHRFANGDALLYVGGTYVIPGLTNNTTYWVYASNTSGFKLSSDNTNPVAINAIATNDISHTFTGSPLYFASDTTGVSDVTSDFYIDHNQNEDYYNTSYLYLKPRATTALTANSVLLVKYDLLTHAAAGGMKHIGSYPLNDTLPLANSSSTMNTLEIPSMYAVDGDYYDLRDSVDFRPVANTTANTTANTWTGWTINPIEPAANNKFGGVELYFPAPESSFSGNLEWYIGRVDRIVVTENGVFDIIKGAPGTSIAPAEPQNCMSINNITIPPYPSLPQSLSTNIVEFADTKIANELYTTKRLTDYRITTQFTDSDFIQEQPRVYKMSDIGSIDRRVRDLEYYVALTQRENAIKNKNIPSEIDPSIERFKYGFFVDQFEDISFSDVDHPEYNASIFDGKLVPKYNEFNIEMKFNNANNSVSALTRNGKSITLPYEEYPLVFQSVATDGAVGAQCAIQPVQKTISVDIINRSTSYNTNGSVFEDWKFTMSETTGTCELYMNCTDNDTAVVILQSTSPSYTTTTKTTSSQFAIPNIAGTSYVQPGGRAYLVGGRSRWENDTGFRSGGPAEAGGKWIEDSYRMSWTHDPSKGAYYIVRVYKGSHLVTNDYDAPRGTYAFRLWYPTDESQCITPSTPSAEKFQYRGNIILENNRIPIRRITTPTYYGRSSSSMRPVSVSRNANISMLITGLKPSTLHKIYLDGIEITQRTLQNVSRLSNYTPSLNAQVYSQLTRNGYNQNYIVSDRNGSAYITINIFNDLNRSDFADLYSGSYLSQSKNIYIISNDVAPSGSSASIQSTLQSATSWAAATIAARGDFIGSAESGVLNLTTYNI